MAKVLLSLSGGMDSGVLAQFLLKQGHDLMVAHFNYPSKHNKYEAIAEGKIMKHYALRGVSIDANQLFSEFKSNLLESGGEIPEGHYAAPSMSQTVIPGRNLIFAAILAGLAESLGMDYIALAVHTGDHHIYPDCRPNFIANLKRTIECSSDEKISLMAPFLNISKADIVRFGLDNGFPFDLTRTCYKDQPMPCGVCGSCYERQESFFLNGEIDWIEYENPMDRDKWESAQRAEDDPEGQD